MLIQTITDRIKKLGSPIDWETEATKAGCVVYTRFAPGERYVVDFADDFHSDGWEQFDTDQDAHYFGVWLNREKFLQLTYAEGDWSLVECPDAERYNKIVEQAIAFYGEGKIATVIGEAGDVTVYHQERERFLVAE